MAGSAPARPSGRLATSPTATDARLRAFPVKAALSVLLAVSDVVMLCGAFVLGYYARLVLPLFAIPDTVPPLLDYAALMVLHVATTGTLFYLGRLYHQPRAVSRIDQARTVLGSVMVGTVFTNGLYEFLFRGTPFLVDYPQSMLFYVGVFSALMAVAGRELFRSVQWRLRTRGIDADNLLVVGNGDVAEDIIARIQQSPYLGYTVVGLVVRREDAPADAPAIAGVPVIGVVDDLPALIDTHSVAQVIIALPEARRAEMVSLITLCQRGRVDIKIYPDLLAAMSGDMNLDDLGGIPLITVRDIALRGWKLSLKRGLDVFGSLAGLVVLSPLMLLTALLIRLESAGPVFLPQQRMSLDGRRFAMIKFRSMRPDAEAAGPGWTVRDDPRVTRIGRFMRRTNWDEIPQLINVLLGDMSLVGPRPEREMWVDTFRQRIPRYMERLREKGGMTGWAQVNGLRGDTSIEERLTYDLWYVENWSLWLDVKIILRTVWQTLMRRTDNAY